ncbi:DUF4920 domain-containing protein [Shewanella corallii]|uniref:DUF4920 domain-containing protein n=1 Tax=Shewanella corallii TaxID=560080 RepID=A0ABT0NBY2_9GAMM|nr:DUF4920 domain-containing protein [Shewanella corallii]MCL2915934.1 DUF4920 domain-containing protein [Shewanella corallii]
MLPRMIKALPLAVLLTGLSVQAEPLNFGSPVDATKVTPISTLMATPDNYLQAPVTIEGTVVAVCQKRGCWMSIASDKRFQNLKIKVKDGDMVFPMSAKGSKAIATGMLQKHELDLEATRKMMAYQAKEQGESFDPATITEGMNYYQLVPVGVSILD